MENRYHFHILFIKKCLLFTPIYLIVVFLNYYVDPENFFSAVKNFEAEKKTAQLLLEGHTEVIRLVAYSGDPRLVQKIYIKSLGEGKDVVVFGSSRSWQIVSRDICPGMRFFNNSIPGGRLEDFMAIYNIYREENKIPKVIIFELNHEHLCSGDGKLFSVNMQYPLKNEYQTMLKLLGFNIGHDNFLNIVKYEALKTLFSPRYLQLSLLFLLNKFFFYKKKSSSVVNELGAISGVNELRLVRLRALDFEKSLKNRGKERFCSDQIAKFEAFVMFLLNDGVRVIFFLPPYHPEVYKSLDKLLYGEAVFSAQAFFLDFAKKHKIELFGSCDSASCGLDEADFTDGYHLRETSTRKIFKNIKF